MSFNRTFYDDSLNKQSSLLIVIDKQTEKQMREIVDRFIEQKKLKTFTFDLEFNQSKQHKTNRVMALIQIALFIADEIFILIVDPTIMCNLSNNKIKNLFSDKSINKIGHGTDSLDIPALQLYLDNDEHFMNFILSLYDTRFLCEYINSMTDNRLCNIYHCLETFNVVSKKQIDFLHHNEKKLGKLWFLKKIHITTLSPQLIDYAMYDALYLKKLANNLKEHIVNNGLKYNLINEITRFVLLLRQDALEISNIDTFNSFILENKSTLKTSFQLCYDRFYENVDLNIKKILNYGFFRNRIMILFQTIYFMTKCLNEKVKINKSLEINSTHKKFIKNSWNKIQYIIMNFPSINKLIQIFMTFM